MKWLFLTFIFLAAIVLGFEIAQDPGYALFVYKNWMVQMPLWLVFLFIFILLIAVCFFTRIVCNMVFLKRSLRFWWLERRFRQKEIKK